MTKTSTLRERLEQSTGEYPPSWKAEPGAIVAGELVRYSTAPTKLYGDQLVAVINDDRRGPLTVWLSSAVLLDQFKKLRPKPGEAVGIKCLGKHPEKHYWRFTVEVDRPGATSDAMPDWDNVTAAEQAPADDDDDFDPFA